MDATLMLVYQCEAGMKRMLWVGLDLTKDPCEDSS